MFSRSKIERSLSSCTTFGASSEPTPARCLCTGGGKSLLFQLPALLDEPGQLTLVFSPLLALQEDQVSALKKKGVRAALLNSSLSKRRHAATLRNFVQNGGLLYLAPEQLRREDVRTALSTARVRRVVVDEVHILPQVDRGFRPAYAEIGAFIKSLRIPPQILAFTATATVSDFSYIAQSLHMVGPKLFLFSVKRSNIKISIKEFNIRGKDNVKRRKRTQRSIPRPNAFVATTIGRFFVRKYRSTRFFLPFGSSL